MKAVAILGGLGSQMFKYAYYLQMKENDECCIDTLPYEMSEMWNGYELKRIFGIEAPELAEYIPPVELKVYMQRGFSYKELGVYLLGRIAPQKPVISIFRGYVYPRKENKYLYFGSLIYNKIKRWFSHGNDIKDTVPGICTQKWCSIYFDEFNHVSDKYIGGGTRKEELKKIFRFPVFIDDKNAETAVKMEQSESVAVHVRRSDHMYDNIRLFEEQYFAKAVNYIKEQTQNPVFYIFSDEPQWCRENMQTLGLTASDNVEIIDWNIGEESYRDMQLMTCCKHNILVISSFSWWGYYLSRQIDKVVCAPEGYWMEVPVHF